MVKCMKCGSSIAPHSAFALVLRTDDSEVVSKDVLRADGLSKWDCALHLNGDPECKKPLSGYLAGIIEHLDLSEDFDMSFLFER